MEAVVRIVREELESLRSSLLGELQGLRENMTAVEERVDCLFLERLQQEQANLELEEQYPVSTLTLQKKKANYWTAACRALLK